ncbi:CRISPR-associated RAMP protein, Csm5 family [Chlorobaculum parvum NCIB 8327]|uniref:CRISPR system Cms protein Csm5 n=1 Tax=Chlorobaculum parvum (strain DSM 263 / NCIMB 8327) TaxID=517417 RepID=B3QRI9_CHLP8|nr:RAMP superfamily CRISPR-associated protein [Chlorobaculum parvum]ACF10511.1 CRISPR-associated RAMP protein, Csm5 family [Chlorobaculum parvum NCIB 8327]
MKGKSIQYFLDNLDLLEKNKKSEIERLSRGVTTLHLSNKNKKFIQNGCGERFLPGSSIKGAIRNALLWKMLNADMGLKLKFSKFAYDKFQWCEEWTQAKVLEYINGLSGLSPQKQEEEKERYKKKKPREFASRFSRKDDDAPTSLAQASLDSITLAAFSPEFAGNKALVTPKYIKEYNEQWGKATDIHRDLSRIIRITDANFIERAKWKKIDIATYNLRGERFQKRDNTFAKLEATDKTTKAWFRITLDHDLAREFFGNSIPTYLQSIENILKTVSEFFYAVAREELDFYGKATHVGPVHAVKKWYEELLRSAELEGQEGAQLFRLGWGGGMMTKTQFLHLDEKDRKRSRDLMNPRDETVAPQSRCLQTEKVNGNNNRNQEDKALHPLGWCTLRYLGSNIAKAKDASANAEAKRQATEPAPPGCVRATIMDDESFPIKIKIEEGEYQNSNTNLKIMELQDLQNTQFKKGVVVFVQLNEQQGKKGKKSLRNATYRGKP